MASQWDNGLNCIKHCWGVYEWNSIMNSACVDDWTAESAIIASNASNSRFIAICTVFKQFYSTGWCGWVIFIIR